jgi:cystathionine beta-lyase
MAIARRGPAGICFHHPMSSDFDNPPDRRGTDSQKWQKYQGRDVLPMWVADMDFRSPPAIIEAIRRRAEHGIFGYSRPVRSAVETVVRAMHERYGWTIDPAWLVWLPGLVCGLNVAIKALASEGDEVISLTPVYPPFSLAPKGQGRVTRNVPLALNASAGRWEIDWDAMEAAVNPRTKVLIICHPHNPVARVWTHEEIARTAEFCSRHGLTLLSDEIHCDLLLEPGARHEPAAVAAPAHSGRIATFMAPSKTYNGPGLGASLAIIPDQEMRSRFARAAMGIVAEVNVFGYEACEAAYGASEPWRQELLAYLRGNRDFLLDFVGRELPGVRIEAPIQATYLAWMNVSALGLQNPARVFEEAGVGLSDGAPFGARPGTHVRLNFGCPRSTLVEGLSRMRAAVRAR